jgi:transposase
MSSQTDFQKTTQRREFTAEEKLQIVLEGLRGDAQLSEVCRRHGISTTLFYTWRDKLTGAAKEAFSRRGHRKGDEQAARLQEEIARKDQVIAEMPACR